LSIGAPVVKSLRKHTDAFLDCHCMVSKPEQWVDDFAAAGANQYTFHIEATTDAPALVAQIKARGMKAGVAISPDTSMGQIHILLFFNYLHC
jgi:ribulose-phosphate 3-epimerase